MITKLNSLTREHKIIERPRIEGLLEQASDYPLISIVAAPGYGKTTAVKAFTKKSSDHVVWFSFSMIDNNREVFWSKLANAFRVELPTIADLVQEMQFPETEIEFIKYTKMIAEHSPDDQRFLFVIDNCELIINDDIISFFNRSYETCRSEINRWHWIIIANTKLDIKYKLFHLSYSQIGERFHIGSKELAFSVDEVRALNTACRSSQDTEEIEQSIARCQGWPMYHVLLCEGKSPSEAFELLSHLFEIQFFNTLEHDIQQLFIKLSYLPKFSLEIVNKIYKGDTDYAVKTLMMCPFVDFAFVSHFYNFQNAYREFLQFKLALIPDEERTSALEMASAWFFENSYHHEALELYRTLRNYEKIVDCLDKLVINQFLSLDLAYIQTVLQEIPHEYSYSDPRILYFQSLLSYHRGELRQSKHYLNEFLDRFEKEPCEIDPQMIGEAYYALANISILQADMKGLPLIKRAVEYLPKGSKYTAEGCVANDGHNVCFLINDGQTSVNHIRDYIYEFNSYRERISGGCFAGFDYLFDAELSVLSLDFARAESRAEQAIAKASSAGQHNTVLGAYYILGHIALYHSDNKESLRILKSINDYITLNNATYSIPFRDTIETTFYLKTGESENVPAWIKEAALGEGLRESFANGDGVIACAYYAVYVGNYARALAILTSLDRILDERALWQIRLFSHILKAICYRQLSDSNSALEELNSIYSMMQPHGFIYPLLEFHTYISLFKSLALSTDVYDFDKEWFDRLEEESILYANRIGELRRDIASADDRASSINLSSREHQVLTLLSQGFSRKAIAKQMNISENGVKKHLSSLYKKLGAKSRAEAVFLASKEALI